MPAVVVDTDVVSFLFKADTRADLYRPHLTGKTLIVSFMTVAELERWAIARRWGEKRKRRMEAHLGKFLVQHSNRPLCVKWAEATQGAEAANRPIRAADAWIAATALLHNIPLVTHNAKDYAGVPGLTVITERGP